MRHVAVRGADGDREVGIARIVDGQRHARAGRADGGFQRAVARVAGGDHHDHAGLHQPIDLDAERALAAGEPLRLEIVAEAHVDAVDEQAAAVAVDLLHVVDGRDQIADRAFAVLIEHPQADQLASRRHAADALQLASAGIRRPRCPSSGSAKPRPAADSLRRVRRHAPFARDDPGDVRAVAVFVVERAAAIDREIVVQGESIDVAVLVKCG